MTKTQLKYKTAPVVPSANPKRLTLRVCMLISWVGLMVFVAIVALEVTTDYVRVAGKDEHAESNT